MAGVEEAAIRGQVDIGTAVAFPLVGLECLDGSQFPVVIGEDDQPVPEFAKEVGKSSVGAENHVPGAEFLQSAVLPGRLYISQGTVAFKQVKPVDTVVS